MGLAWAIVTAFQFLSQFMTSSHAAAIAGAAVYPLAFLALRRLGKTYGVDLDYVEK